MKILLIGSGGRENAIAAKLAESRHKPQLYFAPGNPGMAALGQRLDLEATDIQGLLIFAKREAIDLTVVGPEAPLALGIADAFREAGLAIFGPDKAGAQLEASKAWAKALMQEFNIPTAGYRHCQTEAEALAALDAFSAPYVIKEDGLAAGKGVTIAQDRAEAEAAIRAAFVRQMTVVIEEFLHGEELSLLCLCDGETALPLSSAQDFKRAYNGDQGPNTGGMGAYAPVPWARPELVRRIQDEILDPTVAALKARGIRYQGVIYLGLMISPTGEPKVIEYNARFGDPETQVVLPLLAEDLVDLLLACTQGTLKNYAEPGIRAKAGQSAVTVVLASEGYPGQYETGVPINFPDFLPQQVEIYHAGTRVTPAREIVTAGGRVLSITALAPSLVEARKKAYEVAAQVKFKTRSYRTDIAEVAAQKAAEESMVR